MMHLWKNSSRLSGTVFSKGLCSVLQRVKPVRPVLPPHLFSEQIFCDENEYTTVFDREVDRVLSLATDYETQAPSAEGLRENYALTGLTSADPLDSQTESYVTHDIHSPVLLGLNGHVSLNGCMQTNVPTLYSCNSYDNRSNDWSGHQAVTYYNSHLNMPGSGRCQLDKYQSGMSQFCHPSRHFSTSARQWNQSSEVMQRKDILQDPTPQGVQGDNCVSFKLWMENCQRYNLPNCDEQLASIESGKKTLAQVFMEQEEIIRLVAESYKKQIENEINASATSTNAQGVQDSVYNFEFADVDQPCPQGLQGDDCENFKFWAYNCQAFGFPDCADKAEAIIDGRRTLQDVFDEQDEMIRKIVQQYQSKDNPTGGNTNSSSFEVGSSGNDDSDSNQPSNSNSALPNDPNVQLTSRQKLKQAIKEYGITVNVFYISLSLSSLGGFYLLVSSGLDVVAILNHLGGFGEFVQSRIPTGATTFVMAYVIHKVFAPVRIALTIGCTPLIVRHLRKIGFLKPPKPS